MDKVSYLPSGPGHTKTTHFRDPIPATEGVIARPSGPDFGPLYIGDPYNHAQNLKSVFGKILRIDPLGRNSANGKYGIPPSNPFVKNPDALGEIYSYGHRNPAALLVGSEERQHVRGGDRPEHQRGDQPDRGRRQLRLEHLGGQLQVLQPRSQHRRPARRPEDDLSHRRLRPHRPAVSVGRLAATGIYVYREKAIKQLTGMLIFGDNPSGEIFYVNADKLPKGGQNFHRILFNDKGEAKTLLQLIKEKNAQQGKPPATRADLRMGWTQRTALRAEQARRRHPAAGAVGHHAECRLGKPRRRRALAMNRPVSPRRRAIEGCSLLEEPTKVFLLKEKSLALNDTFCARVICPTSLGSTSRPTVGSRTGVPRCPARTDLARSTSLPVLDSARSPRPLSRSGQNL